MCLLPACVAPYFLLRASNAASRRPTTRSPIASLEPTHCHPPPQQQVEEALAQQLDDHLVLLQGMGFSPNRRPFEERLSKWEAQLRLVRAAAQPGAPAGPAQMRWLAAACARRRQQPVLARC